MASNQIPPLAPSPGINIYTDHWFILLFWLRFWLRFGHGLGHGCQYTSITTDRTIKWPNPLYPQGNTSVCHSCSLSVSRMLGRSTDLGVGGSSPSGRTTFLVLRDNSSTRVRTEHTVWITSLFHAVGHRRVRPGFEHLLSNFHSN